MMLLRAEAGEKLRSTPRRRLAEGRFAHSFRRCLSCRFASPLGPLEELLRTRDFHLNFALRFLIISATQGKRRNYKNLPSHSITSYCRVSTISFLASVSSLEHNEAFYLSVFGRPNYFVADHRYQLPWENQQLR